MNKEEILVKSREENKKTLCAYRVDNFRSLSDDRDSDLCIGMHGYMIWTNNLY